MYFYKGFNNYDWLSELTSEGLDVVTTSPQDRNIYIIKTH